MASNNLLIKCNTQGGPLTLQGLTSESTVFDLKNSVQQLTDIKPEAMKVLFGYPPRALGTDQDGAKLREVNISSGDTVIIETVKQPEATFSASSASCVPQENPTQAKMSNEEVEQMMFYQGGILMRHVVPSDNSCLFNSVFYLLSGGDPDTQSNSLKLRQVIANAVFNKPDKYNAAFLGMENAQYCQWILDSNHWGGAIELAILSEHFKTEIVAVDTISLRMHRFGENENYVQRIFLIYDGIHYDPLLLELESTRQTIFSKYETNVFDLALEIAREAKESRQFTDVANFNVVCHTCRVRFRGDREALDHARATGHDRFGEM